MQEKRALIAIDRLHGQARMNVHNDSSHRGVLGVHPRARTRQRRSARTQCGVRSTRLRRERIKRLSARERARDAVHGKRSRLLRLELLDEL